MIPVGVGRGLMSSMKRMANQEITDKRQKKIKEKKEAGQKSLIARFLLGIRFWIERLFMGKSAAVLARENIQALPRRSETPLVSMKNKQA